MATIKELFSRANADKLSDELQPIFIDLCQSEWVREWGDWDWEEYKDVMSDIDYELANADEEE